MSDKTYSMPLSKQEIDELEKQAEDGELIVNVTEFKKGEAVFDRLTGLLEKSQTEGLTDNESEELMSIIESQQVKEKH